MRRSNPGLHSSDVFHHPFVTDYRNVTHWRHHAVGVTGFGHGERLQAGLAVAISAIDFTTELNENTERGLNLV